MVSILEKSFGFVFVSQKGSHIKLRRMIDGKAVMAVVPKHRELAQGTMHSILRKAQVDANDFLAAK